MKAAVQVVIFSIMLYCAHLIDARANRTEAYAKTAAQCVSPGDPS